MAHELIVLLVGGALTAPPVAVVRIGGQRVLYAPPESSLGDGNAVG